MGLTYVDSCIWIYAFEDKDDLGIRTLQRIRDLSGAIATSELVRMECLVKPFRQNDLWMIDTYERAFALHQRLSIGREQYERATVLRARHGIGTADAIHLATAQTHGCRSFWTNDRSLAAAAGGLDIEVIG